MAGTIESTNKTKGKPTQEEIIQKFQSLRAEQRQFALKLSELEQELHEHKLVLETLKAADPGRRCFRLVSGVLCEMTVADVAPVISNNCDQLQRLIASLKEEVISKGRELVEHKERYNIRIRGAPGERPSLSSGEDVPEKAVTGKEPSSVLVGGDTPSVE